MQRTHCRVQNNAGIHHSSPPYSVYYLKHFSLIFFLYFGEDSSLLSTGRMILRS